MADDSTTTVAELREHIARFVADRDWEQFHDPKNLTMSIAIEAAELMEHFQWLRSDEIEQITSDPDALRQVREELADVLAFVLSLANALGVDVSQALAEKMAKNELKYPAERFRGRFK